jgi:hypothetical protein
MIPNELFMLPLDAIALDPKTARLPAWLTWGSAIVVTVVTAVALTIA